MAAAVNLVQAAGQTYQNLFPWYLNNTLKTRLTTFWNAILPTFPDQEPNSRPVADWLVLIASLADQMPTMVNSVPFASFDVATNYVYRLCYIGNFLTSRSLITPAQGAALLAAYNAAF